MDLDTNEVSQHLMSLFGQYEDSFQEAWVEILEHNPQTIYEIRPIARKVRNRAIRRYLTKKYKEESLHRPIGRNGDESFTLESVLHDSSANHHMDAIHNDDSDSTDLYERMINFLIGEYLKQRNENLELKKEKIELKKERVRLRGEWLKFKRDRFESWKRLMEEKGKRKEYLLTLHIQLQREKLELRKERIFHSSKTKRKRPYQDLR